MYILIVFIFSRSVTSVLLIIILNNLRHIKLTVIDSSNLLIKTTVIKQTN